MTTVNYRTANGDSRSFTLAIDDPTELATLGAELLSKSSAVSAFQILWVAHREDGSRDAARARIIERRDEDAVSYTRAQVSRTPFRDIAVQELFEDEVKAAWLAGWREARKDRSILSPI